MPRKLFAAALAAGLIAAPLFAADTAFPLNGESAKVTFVGTKPDGKHAGGFKTLTGTATVSDNNPATLKLDVEIVTDSIYSDNEKLTGHLKNADFFSVKEFPKAAFKTTKVEKTAAGYAVTGDLTMVGQTKPVTFPAAVKVENGTLTLTSEFKIDRTQWGMKYGQGKISDQVDLKLAVTAKAK